MRKIVVTGFMTLDGVLQAPGGKDEDTEHGFTHGGWTSGYGGNDFQAYKLAELACADALLLGRVTYQIFAASWPHMTETDVEFATMMNGYAKHVASTTLKGPLAWNNARLIQGDIAEAITMLKDQPGKDILVYGSGMLTQALMQHDLVDAYHLQVYPVMLGNGKRLFKTGSHASLKLVEVKTLDSSIVALTYQRVEKS